MSENITTLTDATFDEQIGAATAPVVVPVGACLELPQRLWCGAGRQCGPGAQ
jgi:hypothetical protein